MQSLKTALFAFLVAHALYGSTQEAPAFRVTIIAVTEFQDPELQKDDQLNAANTAAANNLKSFFDKHFHVKADLYTTPSETSAEFLRTWLFQDLPLDSRKAVHLIFVLTHGFAFKTPDNAANKRELFLATSDTFRNKFVGKAIRGQEFIEAFKNMPPRATAFLFLDSCGSGSIDGDNLKTELEQDPEFASRVMILAAANSDESAYSARFTKTLTNIWQATQVTNHCGPSSIAKYLTTSLKDIPNVSKDVKQTVRVVAPLSPDFCIESLNYNQRLLLLYNAAPGDVLVTLQSERGTGTEDPILLKKHQMAPVNLGAGKYNMIAQRSPEVDRQSNRDAPIVKTISFDAAPAQVEVLFSSDPLDNAEGSELAGQYLQSREAFPAISNDLRASSHLVLGREATRLDAEQQRAASEEASLNHAWRTATADTQAKRSASERANSALEVAANQLNTCTTPFLNIAACASILGSMQNIHALAQESAAEYADSERELELRRRMISDMLVVKSRLAEQSLKLNQIRERAARFDASVAHSKAMEQEVIGKLTGSFPRLQRSDRGITIDLETKELTRDRLDDSIVRFIDVLNKVPDLHIEVESYLSIDTQQQRMAARQRAFDFRKKLKDAGLKSSSIAAREIYSPRSRKSLVSIIVSAP